jgi:hypothetical protein
MNLFEKFEKKNLVIIIGSYFPRFKLVLCKYLDLSVKSGCHMNKINLCHQQTPQLDHI